MATTKGFTPLQIANFKRFVKVQRSGKYNMFDPRAASEASLTKDEMVFVMENYEALSLAAEGTV